MDYYPANLLAVERPKVRRISGDQHLAVASMRPHSYFGPAPSRAFASATMRS